MTEPPQKARCPRLFYDVLIARPDGPFSPSGRASARARKSTRLHRQPCLLFLISMRRLQDIQHVVGCTVSGLFWALVTKASLCM